MDTSTTLTSVPTPLAATTADTVNLPVTNYGNSSGIIATPIFTSCRATNTIQAAIENDRLEATESGAVLQHNSSLVHRLSQDNQSASSRNSKHGQTKKHFCTYSSCSRSQPGLGFYRKDHLDQHLRGVHRQNSVSRLCAKLAAASSSRNTTGMSKTTGVLLQSRKRKLGSEGGAGQHNGDGLFEELAEERRLRLLTDQENYHLRQKLENYEERMQKYEERMDKIMALLEEHKGEKSR